MASIMYSKLLPDYGDLDNASKTAPGYRVYIRENDGGIGLELFHANENLSTGQGSSVFLNLKEARELIKGIEKAIERAEPKKANHKARGIDC